MEIRAGQVVVHYVEHGTGRPVLVLHGAGVDHREAQACFEPVFHGVAGLRRIHPDLPGMGRTLAPETLRSADDVLDTLLTFADEVTGGARYPLLRPPAGAGSPPAAAAPRTPRSPWSTTRDTLYPTSDRNSCAPSSPTGSRTSTLAAQVEWGTGGTGRTRVPPVPRCRRRLAGG